MRAIILDDEKHCITTLKSLLQKYTHVEVVKSFSDPLTALKEIRDIKAEIFFLDIEMPHLNGFEFLINFPDYPWQVIFTTAYDDYALKAFKYHAVDYLLKPIDKNDLLSTIEKCEKLVEKDNSVAMESALHNELKIRINKIVVPTLQGLELVHSDDVLYLESESNYTKLHKETGEIILISKTLKHFEKNLRRQGFLRIHNSYIINLNKVKRYVKGDGGYVIMENSSHLNVSRSRKIELLNRLSDL